jgi:DNA topoisomerase-1
VNNYLREVSGEDVTAKDFRTWWGSVIALAELQQNESEGDLPTSRKKRVRQAVKTAAEALGNTQTVCRNCYIHPGLLKASEAGQLRRMVKTARRTARQKPRELTSSERLLAALLPLLTAG